MRNNLEVKVGEREKERRGGRGRGKRGEGEGEKGKKGKEERGERKEEERRKKKKTKVGIQKKAEKTEFALCIAGQHPEVELPGSMSQYIDPLTKLTYCKEVVFGKKLTDDVYLKMSTAPGLID